MFNNIYCCCCLGQNTTIKEYELSNLQIIIQPCFFSLLLTSRHLERTTSIMLITCYSNQTLTNKIVCINKTPNQLTRYKFQRIILNILIESSLTLLKNKKKILLL